MKQQIQFCTSSDKVGIAYASVGTGPPFVKAANWMNHLELDWQSPVWSHLVQEVARDHLLIRYDERGTGLSDRDVDDLSLDAFVEDLRSVVEAVGVDQFTLLGISQGGPVAVEYACRYPEKVSKIILFGSFAAGWKKSALTADVVEKMKAQVTLIRQGWSSRNPAIRQIWTTLCLPGGTPEEANSFNELQRLSASPENAARIFEALGDFDVRDRLPELKVPVLVMHSRGDSLVRFEEGRRLASMIPDARFIPLESPNHLLMRHEPAWSVFVSEMRQFLGRELPPPGEEKSSRMKRCSNCGRVYSDLSLNFCLEDGMSLSFESRGGDPFPEETKIFPNGNPDI
jgi:pimeloyl-ACP methyl ester carboxylesterase